jgi:hypothetical protein
MNRLQTHSFGVLVDYRAIAELRLPRNVCYSAE